MRNVNEMHHSLQENFIFFVKSGADSQIKPYDKAAVVIFASSVAFSRLLV
jgi:hypothetical protein